MWRPASAQTSQRSARLLVPDWFDIQERATRLGADLPFGLSADQFAHLTGVSLSPYFIHDT